MKYSLFGLFALVLFLSANVTHAATTFEGIISVDTVWTASSSPYILSGKTTIASGSALTLEKGVIVKLNQQGIVVSGALYAEGTEAEPVYITSKKDDSVGGDSNGDGSNTAPALGNWQGIQFNAGAIGTLNHTVIRYAGFSNSGSIPAISTIQNLGATIVIRDSEFASSRSCGIGQLSGTTELHDSSMHDMGCGAGILGGSFLMVNNRIENSETGIFSNGAGRLELTDNTFINNTYTADINLHDVDLIHSGNTALGGLYGGLLIRGTLDTEVHLTKDSMPYIITSNGGSGGPNGIEFIRDNNLTIGSTGSLTIEPGVVVKFHNSGALHMNGTLESQGTVEDPVYFTSIKDDSISGDTNGDALASTPAIGDWLHIRFNLGSTGLINNSIIKYGGYLYTTSVIGASGANIYNKGGTVTISGSEITQGKRCGIRSELGSIMISQSNIHANSGCGISSEPLATVDARNNYWGDPSGPLHATLNPQGLGESVSTNVLFEPWKGNYCTENCYSSVLFLPGIKGSILKQGTNTLWPPSIWSTDVKQLALTEEGESAPGIYVDGILDMFYTEPIYQPFSTFMDTLVSDETISEWKTLPYDWRFSPDHILQDGVITEDGVIDLIEEIEKVAKNSNTGRVTIISHSMGGIMGKAIIARMAAMGRDDLIDSFVMVGTPQLGTPQAVAGLLHGDDEAIERALGLISIVNKADSRAAAQNMQSSYNLLPSEEYFEKVSDPVISFDTNTAYTDAWRAEWGATIDSYQELKSFMTGNGVSRVSPPPQQFLVPEVLDFDLAQNAQYWHQDYDFYEFPESIRVVQIAGWGVKTLKGIEYKTGHYGGIDYKAQFTGEGDSTVVYPSAISTTNEEVYYFDAHQYLINSSSTIIHKDLMSAQPIQTALLDVISNIEINTSDVILESKPNVSGIESELVVSVHSPVVLGAYDNEGNFTGISHEQDLENDYLEVTEEIPGSSFRVYGESQYLFLPKTGKYRIVYYGVGDGLTTVEIEDFSNDTTLPLSKFTDIPTTVDTVASFELNSSTPQGALIQLDANGDGINDSIINKDGYVVTIDELILELKTKINSLSLQPTIKRALLANVSILEQILKTKNQKIRKALAELNIAVQKVEIEALRKKGKISVADAEMLSSILNQIKSKL